MLAFVVLFLKKNSDHLGLRYWAGLGGLSLVHKAKSNDLSKQLIGTKVVDFQPVFDFQQC